MHLDTVYAASSPIELEAAWTSWLQFKTAESSLEALAVRWTPIEQAATIVDVVAGAKAQELSRRLEARSSKDKGRFEMTVGAHRIGFIGHQAGHGTLYGLGPANSDTLTKLQPLYDEAASYMPYSSAVLAQGMRDVEAKAIFNRLKDPAVIIDTQRRVLSSNTAFQSNIQSSPPVKTDANNRLAFADDYEQADFVKALSAALDGTGETHFQVGYVAVQVDPLGDNRRYILVLRDLSEPRFFTVAEVRQKFRLTPRQCELVAALLNGMSLSDFSDAQDLSYATARFHLNATYDALDCGRSVAELIRYAFLRLA